MIVSIFFLSNLKKTNLNESKAFKYSYVLNSFLFGSHEKCIFIHALKDLHDKSNIFFLNKLGMDNNEYGIIN